MAGDAFLPPRISIYVGHHRSVNFFLPHIAKPVAVRVSEMRLGQKVDPKHRFMESRRRQLRLVYQLPKSRNSGTRFALGLCRCALASRGMTRRGASSVAVGSLLVNGRVESSGGGGEGIAARSCIPSAWNGAGCGGVWRGGMTMMLHRRQVQLFSFTLHRVTNSFVPNNARTQARTLILQTGATTTNDQLRVTNANRPTPIPHIIPLDMSASRRM